MFHNIWINHKFRNFFMSITYKVIRCVNRQRSTNDNKYICFANNISGNVDSI